MPKDKKGRLRKDYLRVGVDELCPSAGLPPVGAVDEVCCHIRNLIMMSNLCNCLRETCDLNLPQQSDKVPTELNREIVLFSA
jgi:hypothetical protein